MDKEQAKKDWGKFFTGFSTRFVLTYTVIVVAAAIIIMLFFIAIPEVNKIILISAISYWFGYGSASWGHYFTTNKDMSDRSKIDAAKDLNEITKPDANA